jgi:imidazolonepropionase
MSNDLLITNASQLLTLAGPARARVRAEMKELGIIDEGCVLIRDRLVVATGTLPEIETRADRNARRIDARGCVVLPGFVDSHTHPVFAGTREDEYEMRAMGLTYEQIAERGGGIRATVRRTRAATEDELFEASKARVRWFLDNGTTTIEAKSGYGLSVDDELKILRVIRRLNDETQLELIPTFLGAHEIPDEYRGSVAGAMREDYLGLILDQMLPAVIADDLARYCDVFCERGVFTPDEALRVLSRAKTLGLGVRIHAEQLSASGGAQVAASLGAASADHLDWIDDEGMVSLASAGVVAVLLPGAVFNLGLKRYPPARAMIEAGLPVALATDFNPGSSPTPSMQMILSIACSQLKMTPAEAITAATINPAYSVGRGAAIGSIEPGKQADLTIFGCDDYRQIPYFYGLNHARVVIKAGQPVYTRPV